MNDVVKKRRTKSDIAIEELQSEIEQLKAALSKIAVLGGHGNHLSEFGLERWEPGAKDMGKRYG